jgi:uncharacterized protein YecT (DUF1311 family)
MNPFANNLASRPAFLTGFVLILFLPLSVRTQDCPPVTLGDFPKQDLPRAIDSATARNKESYKYYYGIGVRKDYVKARKLAFLEMKFSGNTTSLVDGAAVLLMIYANGLGVKRNYDLCIRLACSNVGGSNAEVEGRVEHLRNMQAGKDSSRFDICDDITSGLMMGVCEGIHQEMADIKRNAALERIIRTWTKKDHQAYDTLRKSASTFFDLRLLNEVDMSGTARSTELSTEEESLEDGFLAHIRAADKKLLPAYRAGDFEKADKALNTVYSGIMSHADTLLWGTVRRKDILATQRQWISYREAWVVFGQVRCPAISAAAWRTLITRERTRQLKDFME